MSEKPYIKNQKDQGGSKWLCAQDQEDFEQEKLIKEWLKHEGNDSEFGYQHINRKGNARNTLVRASISLDQKITEDGQGTFADLIAGCDGRDLVCRDDTDESPAEAIEVIYGYLSALGFNKGEIEWLTRTLKLSILENNSHFEKYRIDLEW